MGLCGSSTISDVNHFKVVVFALVKVGEFPVDTDILQGQVVPILIVWVVWHLIVMQVLALSEHSLQFH